MKPTYSKKRYSRKNKQRKSKKLSKQRGGSMIAAQLYLERRKARKELENKIRKAEFNVIKKRREVGLEESDPLIKTLNDLKYEHYMKYGDGKKQAKIEQKTEKKQAKILQKVTACDKILGEADRYYRNQGLSDLLSKDYNGQFIGHLSNLLRREPFLGSRVISEETVQKVKKRDQKCQGRSRVGQFFRDRFYKQKDFKPPPPATPSPFNRRNKHRKGSKVKPVSQPPHFHKTLPPILRSSLSSETLRRRQPFNDPLPPRPLNPYNRTTLRRGSRRSRRSEPVYYARGNPGPQPRYAVLGPRR